jgi:cytochrome c oxidase assembly protein subunit 16
MNARTSKFTRHFFPFVAIVVGSFIGLAQFRKLNYKYKKNEPIVFKEQLVGIDEAGYQSKTTQSIEKEYEKMMNKIDINKWENIRGPRPWENSKEVQEKIRQQMEEVKKRNL